MKTTRLGSNSVIEAAGTTQQIRRAYDLWSFVYGRVAGPLERGPRRRALELATILPGDRVLDVAVGTGAILLEILKRGENRALSAESIFRRECFEEQSVSLDGPDSAREGCIRHTPVVCPFEMRHLT